MAYEDLKSTANQVSNSFNAGVSGSTFTSSAAPLQTNIMAMFMPKNLQIPDWNTYLGSKEQRTNMQIQDNINKYGIHVDAKGIASKSLFGNKSDYSYTDIKSGKTQNYNTFGQNKETDNYVNTSKDSIDTFLDRSKIQSTGNDSSGAKSGFLNFMGSGAGQAVSAATNLIGGTMNAIGDSVGAYADRPDAQQLNETQESARSAIYSGVSAIPGFGPLISAGLQLTDGLGKLMGTQMSNISKDAAEDAGLSRGFNNVVATIPGIGSLLGAFAKKTDEFEVDRERLAGVGSAYDMSTFDSAEDLSGGKFLGQGNKVNNFIAEQNRLRDTMTSISDTQKLRKEGASVAAADLAQQNKNRYSGLTGGQMAIGKKGIKLDLSWAKSLLSKFQKGGKLGTPGIESNVIVEGAYHAHKNHLDEVNPELSDMTPKGIPVATEDASGNKTQVAEIEVGELILTKALTDKLEELYKDGSDDSAIQAGMLFANEIIDNTVDNKGGVLDEND